MANMASTMFDSPPLKTTQTSSPLDILNMKTVVCQFVSPLDTHTLPVST